MNGRGVHFSAASVAEAFLLWTTTSRPLDLATLRPRPPLAMDLSPARQSRQPRFAITASFTLIVVFLIWLLLPRRATLDDEILPPPIISKVGQISYASCA